jgi:hypothetical protein
MLIPFSGIAEALLAEQTVQTLITLNWPTEDLI